MNARQKAKYYKRKYEELANVKIPIFRVEQHKIDTLRFQRLYPEVLIAGREDVVADIISKDVGFEIASQIDKYVTVKTEFEPHLNQFRVVGEVKVVANG